MVSCTSKNNTKSSRTLKLGPFWNSTLQFDEQSAWSVRAVAVHTHRMAVRQIAYPTVVAHAQKLICRQRKDPA